MNTRTFIRFTSVLSVLAAAAVTLPAQCEQKLELHSKRVKEPNEVAFCGSLFQPTAVLCRGETQDSLSLVGPEWKPAGQIGVSDKGKDRPRLGADCSRSGRYIAVSRRAGSLDESLRTTDVWDVTTQSKRWSRTGTYAPVFLSDSGGAVFAIADPLHEYLIEFFDNAGKRLEQVGPLPFLDGEFALDPSGRYFVAATGDPKVPSRIALYDMTGKEKAAIEPKCGRAVCLGIAPGCSRVVAVLYDDTPGVAVRETLLVLNDRLETVLCESESDMPWGDLAFSADGSCFALAGRSGAQLRKTSDGTVIWRLDVTCLAAPGEETLVREIMPSNNGRFAVVVLSTQAKGAKIPQPRYSLALVGETGQIGQSLSLDIAGGAIRRLELSANESQVALEREQSIERYSIGGGSR